MNKIIKSAAAPAVGAALAVTLAFCGVGFGGMSAKADEVEPSIETVNEYLAQHGYSEEFIANTGETVKTQLYNCGASFESESPVSADDGIMPALELGNDWSGFSGTLTASNSSVSEENVSCKILTFNWKWPIAYLSNNEAVSIVWGNDFTAITSSATLEIDGIGTLQSYHLTSSYIPKPDHTERYRFVLKRGEEACTQYSPNVGIACRFKISWPYTFTRGLASNSYAKYSVQDTLLGTYSVQIKKYSEVNDYNSAVANYFHWTYSAKCDVDFGFTFSIPCAVNLNLSPDVDSYYEKSTDKPVSFKYF